MAIIRPHSGVAVECVANAIFMGLPLDALNASPLLSNVSHILIVDSCQVIVIAIENLGWIELHDESCSIITANTEKSLHGVGET